MNDETGGGETRNGRRETRHEERWRCKSWAVPLWPLFWLCCEW